MPKASEISIEKRVKITVLHEEGYPIRKICERTGVSYGGVHAIISKFKSTGMIKNMQRLGRPKITTKAEDRKIVVTCKRDRFKAAPEIAAEINKHRSKKLSTTTVKRRLITVGLNGRVAAKKPLLRKRNSKARMKFAKDHLHWTRDDWAKVLWTDESKFQIFNTNRRVYVRRFKHERTSKRCIVPTVKHGGGNVMVWGCFSAAGVGDLVEVTGRMKKEQYQKIVLDHAESSGFRLIGAGFELQQDNDPKHTAKDTVALLKKKVHQGMFTWMNWPSQSPDANPIELLWDELDRTVRIDRPTSKTDLLAKLRKNWNEITPECIAKLIQRMPKVCKAIIKAKGGHVDESKI